MKRPPAIRIHRDELIVDNFAGGGGASTGLEWALGRSPDIAINHDPEAIAMHAANHPDTRHFCGNVWDFDPKAELRDEFGRQRRVGVAWFSPDCTFHSKARGAKPFRDRDAAKRRRGLAWVVTRWAKAVKPRIIFCENVEEFQDWGPLTDAGKVDPERKGSTFRRWVSRLENLGYRVEWRQLRACDFGAPTTRKRLFIIARCDGHPIVWPEATHGPGKLPYRTAAECIDWSRPCRSIFGRKRPLKPNTLKRIARGIRKYVLEAAQPFIIPVTHQGDSRSHGVDEPMRTLTAAHRGEHAVVTPVIGRIGQTGGNGKYVNDARTPLTAVTTKGEHMVIAPHLVEYHSTRRKGGERVRPVDAMLPTQDTSNRFALVAPTLIQVSWGERRGQAPRILDVDKPLPTIVAGGIKQAAVTAFLAKHFGGEHKNGKPKARPGTDVRKPVDTITTKDHHTLVTAHVVKLRGGFKDHQNTAQSVEQPLPTLTAGGTHVAEVRAFLIKYYDSDGKPDQAQGVDAPIHTIPTKARFGLVTIAGVDYEIVDICMRMLDPDELFAASSFPGDYKIKIKLGEKRLKNGKVKAVMLSKGGQVRMCGNAVPPVMPEALALANVVPEMVTGGGYTVPRRAAAGGAR